MPVQTSPNAIDAARSGPGVRLIIGVHPNNLHMRLLRALAPPPLAIFVDYADGRSTGALLASGTIDLGGTGSTPPIAAAADGLDVVYVAASHPRPANSGLIVREDTGGLPALVGRRIGLIDGSFHTYHLARLADRAGLRLVDFERVDLEPAVSEAALRTGEIDGWFAMDPNLKPALARGGLRLIENVGDTIPNRSLFWTTRDRKDRLAREIDDAVRALQALGPLIAAQPETAAAALSAEDGLPAERWMAVLQARDWTLAPADAIILAEQQAEAACLLRHGVIGKPASLPGAALGTAA